MKTKHIIAFTYRIYPESKMFFVKCLDWNVVFSQGETLTRCRKNIIQLTEYYLSELSNGNLDSSQYPKIKAHKAHPHQFQLEYDIKTTKLINAGKAQSFNSIKPVEEKELILHTSL